MCKLQAICQNLKKRGRLIPKYYGYLRGSVVHVGVAERQLIGNSSKNFSCMGKTCRPLRNRFCNQALRESATQTTAEIMHKNAGDWGHPS